MAIVSGNAIKYNGEPIDYLIIFDWETGLFNRVVKPGLNGDWSIDLLFHETSGIIYIANGCAPITHGPYDLIGDYPKGVPSGFLLICISYSVANQYNALYDKTATTTPTWNEYFKPVLDIGSHYYINGNSSTAPVNVINDFKLWWNLELNGFINTESSNLNTTIEFLNADDVVIFKLSTSSGYYTVNLYYAIGSGSNTNAGGSSSYPQLNGILSFTESKVIFTRSSGGSKVNSFELNVDTTSVVKVRTQGMSSNSGGSSGVTARLLPRVV